MYALTCRQANEVSIINGVNFPLHYAIFGPKGSETLGMTSEWLEVMFQGDFVDLSGK